MKWIPAEPFGYPSDETDKYRAFTRLAPPRRYHIRCQLLAEQDGCCFYCHRVLHLDESTFDHKKAASKGGTWQKENLVLSCHDCNQLKGIKDFEQFLIEIGHPTVPKSL